MLNLSTKEKIINNTFDEMIARWTANGFYHKGLVENEWMTNLEKLRKIEIFLNNIECLKTDLFVAGPTYVRNVEGVYLDNPAHVKTLFYPTQYAKDSFLLEYFFGNLSYLNGFEIYSVRELSTRIFLFLDESDSNFKQIIKINNAYELVEFSQKNTDFKMKLMKKVFQESGELLPYEISELDTDVIRYLNKKVSTYKERLAAIRSKKNLESSFLKKRKEFHQYFDELVNKYKKLFVFSLNFYLSGNSGKFNSAEIRKDFFNSFRSNPNLKSIVGYMGTWEFDYKNDFYFRVIFFAEYNVSEEQLSLVNTMTYCWEVFNCIGRTQKYARLKFSAELSNISESKARLKMPMCVIGKNSHKLIADFSDSVINYMTLLEKYFFPAELQIFIFDHMAEEKKKKNAEDKYLVENLQYSFSRSFRGHLKIPKN